MDYGVLSMIEISEETGKQLIKDGGYTFNDRSGLPIILFKECIFIVNPTPEDVSKRNTA
jgi:hypothetical protein